MTFDTNIVEHIVNSAIFVIEWATQIRYVDK